MAGVSRPTTSSSSFPRNNNNNNERSTPRTRNDTSNNNNNNATPNPENNNNNSNPQQQQQPPQRQQQPPAATKKKKKKKKNPTKPAAAVVSSNTLAEQPRVDRPGDLLETQPLSRTQRPVGSTVPRRVVPPPSLSSSSSSLRRPVPFNNASSNRRRPHLAPPRVLPPPSSSCQPNHTASTTAAIPPPPSSSSSATHRTATTASLTTHTTDTADTTTLLPQPPLLTATTSSSVTRPPRPGAFAQRGMLNRNSNASNNNNHSHSFSSTPSFHRYRSGNHRYVDDPSLELHLSANYGQQPQEDEHGEEHEEEGLVSAVPSTSVPVVEAQPYERQPSQQQSQQSSSQQRRGPLEHAGAAVLAETAVTKNNNQNDKEEEEEVSIMGCFPRRRSKNNNNDDEEDMSHCLLWTLVVILVVILVVGMVVILVVVVGGNNNNNNKSNSNSNSSSSSRGPLGGVGVGGPTTGANGIVFPFRVVPPPNDAELEGRFPDPTERREDMRSGNAYDRHLLREIPLVAYFVVQAGIHVTTDTCQSSTTSTTTIVTTLTCGGSNAADNANAILVILNEIQLTTTTTTTTTTADMFADSTNEEDPRLTTQCTRDAPWQVTCRYTSPQQDDLVELYTTPAWLVTCGATAATTSTNTNQLYAEIRTEPSAGSTLECTGLLSQQQQQQQTTTTTEDTPIQQRTYGGDVTHWITLGLFCTEDDPDRPLANPNFPFELSFQCDRRDLEIPTEVTTNPLNRATFPLVEVCYNVEQCRATETCFEINCQGSKSCQIATGAPWTTHQTILKSHECIYERLLTTSTTTTSTSTTRGTPFLRDPPEAYRGLIQETLVYDIDTEILPWIATDNARFTTRS